MDYTFSISPPPLTLYLGLLMFPTVAQVYAATQCKQKLNYLLKVTNTVKHDKTCSFCQKPECLHIVKYSATGQLLV